MVADELFEFSFFSDYSKALRELAALAIPESWRFLDPQYPVSNKETPILDRYLRGIYKHLAICYNNTIKSVEKNQYIFVYGTIACFHTGLLSTEFEEIFALFEKSRRANRRCEWVFRGFYPRSAHNLKAISELPLKPQFRGGEMFHPNWEIRINFRHILQDKANLERLPEAVRSMNNLPLLLHAAVLYGQALAHMDPSIVVHQVYNDQVQYLLPICLTDIRYCDMAMTLTACDGYYVGTTCLSLEMAYHNARMLGRPSVRWLAALVDQEKADVGFEWETIYGMRV